MTGLEIWLLAIGLAMDCFAVSIASGIILKRTRWKPILIMAFTFGLFQAIMPFIVGLVSFVMSLIGLIFGIQCGCGIARKLKAELWGGIILVIIGLKILIEHLFLQ